MSALHELDSLDDAIVSLAREPFGASIISSYTAVAAESLEEPFRTLLVHHDHMTEVLSAYHGRAVDLHVLCRTQDADTYTRSILLTAHDSEPDKLLAKADGLLEQVVEGLTGSR